MIVELCGTDLLKLVNGEQIIISDHIVRTCREDHSSVVSEPHTIGNPVTQRQVGPRARTRVKTNKTGKRWMSALFAGACAAPGCPTVIAKGDSIVYDYDKRAAYCAGHGAKILPREAVSA